MNLGLNEFQWAVRFRLVQMLVAARGNQRMVAALVPCAPETVGRLLRQLKIERADWAPALPPLGTKLYVTRGD